MDINCLSAEKIINEKLMYRLMAINVEKRKDMINVENNQECFVVLWRRLERTRRLLGGQCKRYCIRNVL